MKNLLLILLVSLCSSIVTLMTYKCFLESPQKEIVIKEAMPARYTSNIDEQPSEIPNIVNVSEFTDAAQKSTPAVVHIKSGGSNDIFDFGSSSSASGSGVIITENGYIITNNHVVEGSKEVTVTLNDKRSYAAKVIGTDPSTDLAVIKIKSKALKDRKLATLSYGNSDDIAVGQWVLAVGNPFNLTSTVTAGIVSAKGRNIDILEGTYSVESFIQTDAAVNPGNSGGALIDAEGNLVGINTAIITRSGRYEGYSFAVPVNLARKVANDIIEFGSVQRGFLGVTIKDVNNEIAEQYGLDNLDGVYIDRVNTGSAADEANLERGDVITHVNNVKVTSSPELQEQVALFRPGQDIDIVYMRDGKSTEIKVTLKNASNGIDIDTKPRRKKRFLKRNTLLKELGITIRSLTESEKSKMKLENGIIVTEIEKDSPIANMGMQEDFIILTIDEVSLNTKEDFIDAIYNAEEEVALYGFYEGYEKYKIYRFEP